MGGLRPGDEACPRYQGSGDKLRGARDSTGGRRCRRSESVVDRSSPVWSRTMSQTAPAAGRSAIAPLRLPVFRWLWIAAVVSNIGQLDADGRGPVVPRRQPELTDGDRARADGGGGAGAAVRVGRRGDQRALQPAPSADRGAGLPGLCRGRSRGADGSRRDDLGPASRGHLPDRVCERPAAAGLHGARPRDRAATPHPGGCDAELDRRQHRPSGRPGHRGHRDSPARGAVRLRRQRRHLRRVPAGAGRVARLPTAPPGGRNRSSTRREPAFATCATRA